MANGKRGGGGRPSHRLTFVSKDKGEDGRRVYTDVGAAWPSEQKPGSYNVKLEGDAKVKFEGVVFSSETHFINFEPVRPFKDEQQDSGSDEDADDGRF